MTESWSTDASFEHVKHMLCRGVPILAARNVKIQLRAGACGFLLLPASAFVPQKPALPPALKLILIVLGLCGLMVSILSLMICSLRTRRLRRDAQSKNFEICPRCGYWMIGLPSTGACPECGIQYALDHVRQLWQAWIMAMEDGCSITSRLGLRYFHTPGLRRRLWRPFLKRAVLKGLIAAALLACTVTLAGYLSGFAERFTMTYLFTLALFLFVFGPFLMWKRFVLRTILEHDYQLCLRCGLTLVDATAQGTCPGCGQAYEKDIVCEAWRTWIQRKGPQRWMQATKQ